MSPESPYIALLRQYQAASNRYDTDACVALFTEDGRIEMDGQIYQGVPALRDAHEYDVGARTQVAFRDFVVEGDLVRCTFWNEQEFDRVLGVGGRTSAAAFVFRGQKIDSFAILPPNAEEQQRFRSLMAPALRWLREHHPDTLAKWGSFDRAGGDAVFASAELWRAHYAIAAPPA